MSISERIKLIEKSEGLSREGLAIAVGLKYTRLRNVVGGQTKCRLDDLEVIAKAFPQYEYWIFTGKTLPLCGQICPPRGDTHCC